MFEEAYVMGEKGSILTQSLISDLLNIIQKHIWVVTRFENGPSGCTFFNKHRVHTSCDDFILG